MRKRLISLSLASLAVFCVSAGTPAGAKSPTHHKATLQSVVTALKHSRLNVCDSEDGEGSANGTYTASWSLTLSPCSTAPGNTDAAITIYSYGSADEAFDGSGFNYFDGEDAWDAGHLSVEGQFLTRSEKKTLNKVMKGLGGEQFHP